MRKNTLRTGAKGDWRVPLPPFSYTFGRGMLRLNGPSSSPGWLTKVRSFVLQTLLLGGLQQMLRCKNSFEFFLVNYLNIHVGRFTRNIAMLE